MVEKRMWLEDRHREGGGAEGREGLGRARSGGRERGAERCG